jgi:5'(3')-deoxyribonucleotidase
MYKGWLNFLNEEQNRLPQIYCDMDGVLVDFETGVVDQINIELLDDSKPDRKPTGGITNIGRVRKVLIAADRELQIDVTDLRKGGGSNSKAVRNYMYKNFGDDVKFWSELPEMPGGQELWSFISPYNPYILTSPMDEGSQVGKRAWISSHLNPQPTNIYMSHDKWKWATTDGRPNILIDDWDKNLIPWAEHGGIAIRCAFGDSASAIAELKELGFGAE